MVRLKCLLFEETLARVLQACKKTFLFYWRNRYSTGRSCSKADQLLTPHARKGDTRRGERKMKPFLAWGGFHARSRFARSTIPKEKWMTTRSLQYCISRNFRVISLRFAIFLMLFCAVFIRISGISVLFCVIHTPLTPFSSTVFFLGGAGAERNQRETGIEIRGKQNQLASWGISH